MRTTTEFLREYELLARLEYLTANNLNRFRNSNKFYKFIDDLFLKQMGGCYGYLANGDVEQKNISKYCATKNKAWLAFQKYCLSVQLKVEKNNGK